MTGSMIIIYAYSAAIPHWKKQGSPGLETNWIYQLASRASDLENLLALLNSTSRDFFPSTNFLLHVPL